jgi:hypothetical protein
MRDTLTDDGSEFTSNAALARTVGVHRDQVRLWRLNDNAPAGLALSAWRSWLIDTGRTRYAEAIPAVLAGAVPPPAEPAPQDPDGSPDVVEADEGVWKARAARAKALLAERELAEDEGRLVDRALFSQAVSKLGASVLAALIASKPFDAINPTLDGLTPSQREAIQSAFARWIMELRGRIALLPVSITNETLPRLSPKP